MLYLEDCIVFTLVKKPLMFVVVVFCLIVPSFGEAAIGTEPSNQAPEAANPVLGPLPSVPSSPGFLPGMQNEGTTPSYPSMNFASPSEEGTFYYPQYVPPMPQGAGEMPGMMMSPYPSYPGGGEMYPPMYGDPSQYPS